MFNYCSKKKYMEISQLNIEKQSLKNVNTSSFQEFIDLFSDKSIVMDKYENNSNTIKDSQNKQSVLNDYNSLFESNIFNNNNSIINISKKKEIIINSNIKSQDFNRYFK